MEKRSVRAPIRITLLWALDGGTMRTMKRSTVAVKVL